MGLSLLPQTVLALDPDQLAGLAKLVREKVTFEGKTIRLGADIYLLQYEETGKPWWDGIGNATSSTAVFKGTFDGCGHTIDQMLAGSGGVGGVVGQFGDGSIANSYNYGNVTLGEGLVCNNLGGVIGRDMKRSAARVENVYYLDSSCANASTSGAAFPAGWKSAKECDILGKISNPLLRYVMAGGYKEITMEHRFLRTEMVLGDRALDRLSRCHVAVFGLGGVGSYAAEILARSGVGELTLVDQDTLSLTNINRQLYALSSTVGEYKAEAAARRCRDINPDIRVHPLCATYDAAHRDAFFTGKFDYIADCIDLVTCKLDLIQQAGERGIPIISALGTGNKLDPTLLQVTDISRTSVCPLARVMRRELKDRGIRHLPVVFSPEQPAETRQLEAPSPGRRSVPASVPWVPSTAGILMASAIVRNLIANESE